MTFPIFRYNTLFTHIFSHIIYIIFSHNAPHYVDTHNRIYIFCFTCIYSLLKSHSHKYTFFLLNKYIVSRNDGINNFVHIFKAFMLMNKNKKKGTVSFIGYLNLNTLNTVVS